MVHETLTELYVGATASAITVSAVMASAAGTSVCATAEPGMPTTSSKAMPTAADKLHLVVIRILQLPVVETVGPCGPELSTDSAGSPAPTPCGPSQRQGSDLSPAVDRRLRGSR